MVVQLHCGSYSNRTPKYNTEQGGATLQKHFFWPTRGSRKKAHEKTLQEKEVPHSHRRQGGASDYGFGNHHQRLPIHEGWVLPRGPGTVFEAAGTAWGGRRALRVMQEYRRRACGVPPPTKLGVTFCPPGAHALGER